MMRPFVSPFRGLRASLSPAEARRSRRRPALESLEGRLLMATDAGAGAGTIGAVTAVVPDGGRVASLPFTVSPSDFGGRSTVLLKIDVTSLDGGNTRVLGVVSASTGGQAPVLRGSEGDGLLARTPSGSYVLKVLARPADAIRADFRLAGDVDGDFDVDGRDLDQIASARGGRIGRPRYVAAADMQGDGRIGPADLALAHRNLGASSSSRPLALSLGISPAQDPDGDRVVVGPTATLVGHAAPNALATLVNASGAAGPSTVADANGDYRFENVPLQPGANTFTVESTGAMGQQAAVSRTITSVASQGATMNSTERMAHFGLTDVKGMAYTPEPSDFAPGSPLPPNPYFDSDFFNSYYTPMWSSAQNIDGFTVGGRRADGRGDLRSMRQLGVNFLHIYNWNSQRDHSSFLQTMVADGMTVNVPVSNYVFDLPMNGPLGNPPYRHQLSYVQEIFNQVYPGWQRGNTAPVPGISMWSIANEPDNSGGHILPDAVAKVAQMIVYLEDQANIPDGDRLPITVPLSWATEYVGTSYANPTPSVGAMEALFDAFNATTNFTATAMNLRNPVAEPYTAATMTVPKLPADFFSTRFVWANNPVGNDIALFMGLQQGGYAPYNHPAGAKPQIPWDTIPMIFYEVGGTSIETKPTNPPRTPELQARDNRKQMTDMKTARSNGRNPNFHGGAVFQSLDQVTHKVGNESGFGVQTVARSGGGFVYQTITVGPKYKIPSFISNVWRLDRIVPKPALDVVRQAFRG